MTSEVTCVSDVLSQLDLAAGPARDVAEQALASASCFHSQHLVPVVNGLVPQDTSCSPVEQRTDMPPVPSEDHVTSFSRMSCWRDVTSNAAAAAAATGGCQPDIPIAGDLRDANSQIHQNSFFTLPPVGNNPRPPQTGVPCEYEYEYLAQTQFNSGFLAAPGIPRGQSQLSNTSISHSPRSLDSKQVSDSLPNKSDFDWCESAAPERVGSEQTSSPIQDYFEQLVHDYRWNRPTPKIPATADFQVSSTSSVVLQPWFPHPPSL
mmetsp:Transcript_37241/g.88503  ORF Transcript_37241/g.88503 Transcript_37241/m.88503 type:complete len:263 (-) Transcript_37241:787-1575(-)